MPKKNDDHDKLKNLIVYITEQCLDDPDFSIEKLKAVLFKSDMEHFAKTGESITDSRYLKEKATGKATFDIAPKDFIGIARESFANRLRELSEAEYCGHGVRFYLPEWTDRSWYIHRVYGKWGGNPAEDDSFKKAKLAHDILKLKNPDLVVEIFQLMQGEIHDPNPQTPQQ